MPHMWYNNGMARVRISTTVDEQLLATARRTRSELADAALIDEALSALLARHRAGEIEAAYAAYDRVPLDVDGGRRGLVVRARRDRAAAGRGALSRCGDSAVSTNADRPVHDHHPRYPE